MLRKQAISRRRFVAMIIGLPGLQSDTEDKTLSMLQGSLGHLLEVSPTARRSTLLPRSGRRPSGPVIPTLRGLISHGTPSTRVYRGVAIPRRPSARPQPQAVEHVYRGVHLQSLAPTIQLLPTNPFVRHYRGSVTTNGPPRSGPQLQSR